MNGRDGGTDEATNTPNPFQPSLAPEDEPLAGRTPSTDAGIEHEPHFGGAFVPVESSGELAADRVWAVDADLADADSVEHTVWDEPALSGDLSGPAPEGQLTYARWLGEQIELTTWAESWRATLLIALAAGPWGVLGALISQASASGLGFSGLLAAVILAPVTEEITKVGAALWVVEKKPYLFKSPVQVMACAAAGGLAFAAIENLIYLFVYNPGGGPAFAAWRWTVCTGLHVTCSTIVGFGLLAIWRTAIETRKRPELARGMPWFTAAMILHGLYNLVATLAEASGVLSFD